MATEEDLFSAVDALLDGDDPVLPLPAERVRLREAAGVTQARLAQVLRSTTQTVKNWENGRSEPRPPRLQAYQRLLDGWSARYPAPETSVPEAVVPATFTPATPAPAPQALKASAPPADPVPQAPAAKVALGSSRRPGAAKRPP